jgi:hypothetical protein
MTYILPLVIALGVVALGLRQRSATVWIVLALGVTCFLGAFHEMGMEWGNGAGPDELSVGFALAPPFPGSALFEGLWRFALNAALSSAIYLWFARSLERSRSAA